MHYARRCEDLRASEAIADALLAAGADPDAEDNVSPDHMNDVTLLPSKGERRITIGNIPSRKRKRKTGKEEKMEKRRLDRRPIIG